MTTSEAERHAASFRDPSGFLFRREGVLFRQINQSYREKYEAVEESGLLEALTEEGLLIPHVEVDETPPRPEIAFKTLRPQLIPFISYPYEWSFDQLKDAALLTLEIQESALEAGATLKDASAYNVQFHRGRPILIDTLSFEPWVEGEPWVAYRQFCQHFLAPLTLMAKRDVRLSGLLRVHVDGVPLDLASGLLPRRSYLNLGLLTHLHMHASAQRRFAGREVKADGESRGVSQRSLLGLLDSLRRTIGGLEWKPEGSWSDYYSFHNYDPESFEAKKSLVEKRVSELSPGIVWDLGANTGVFSRLAADHCELCVSVDFDPGAVQLNYREVKKSGGENLLPLLLDLTNPSPGLGWGHRERDSLAERGPADLVMALALLHHLAITNNLPFSVLAEYLARISRWLLIEYVPKSDSQAQKLLRSREDIFDQYDRASFEGAFSEYFDIEREERIASTDRVLFLMRRRG